VSSFPFRAGRIESPILGLWATGGAADRATGRLQPQRLQIRVSRVGAGGRSVVRAHHWEHRLRNACNKDAFHVAVPTNAGSESADGDRSGEV